MARTSGARSGAEQLDLFAEVEAAEKERRFNEAAKLFSIGRRGYFARLAAFEEWVEEASQALRTPSPENGTPSQRYSGRAPLMARAVLSIPGSPRNTTPGARKEKRDAKELAQTYALVISRLEPLGAQPIAGTARSRRRRRGSTRRRPLLAAGLAT